MKLKAKTKKAIRGSITLLMVIILLPMMTFSAVIVDTSRINMAKAMMSSAGDLTMNTALANYDTILKDVYGLFAMSQEKSEEELAKDLRNYFADTIAGYGVVSQAEAGEYVDDLIGDFTQLISGTEHYQSDPKDFLALNNLEIEKADRVASSALSRPAILRNQIVEYMKFRAPLTLGMSFLDSLKAIDVVDEQMDVVETQVTAQENTQDITSACYALIKLIREYDDLVKTGNTEVTGQKGSTDGVTVYLKEYPTHVNKYLSAWNENYTHINKLLMVFLAKAPSTASVFLVSMDYEGGKRFISSSGLNYENCGIILEVTIKDETSAAKQDVIDQLAVVNNGNGTASKYKDKKFLSREHMNANYTAFDQEDTAVTSFIGYEQFLLDQNADVKYTDVAALLTDIFKLGKLYDHYYAKISEEIAQAYNDWTAAEAEVVRLEGVISANQTAMDSYVTEINSIASTYYNGNNEENQKIECLRDFKTIQTATKILLRTTNPEISNYETYYADYLQYGNTDKYLSTFKSIVNSVSSSGKGNDKAIAAAAKTYIDNNQPGDFASFIKEQTKDTVKFVDPTNTQLFELLYCLLNCSKKAQALNSEGVSYGQAVIDKGNAEADAANKKAIYDEKVEERRDVTAQYSLCLGSLADFGEAYQRDAYYYGKYIETATAVVNSETAAIKTQFGNIVGNIQELKEKLDEIVTQCGVVDGYIESYLNDVTAWEKEVEAYEKANGEDSFSQQARQDIATARSTYSRDSLGTLKTFVESVRDRYSEFWTYLSGDVYFKYGGKRLHEIGSAEDAKTAAKHNIASITAEVITLQIADTSLTQLYRSVPGSDFIPYTLEGTYTAEQQATGTADERGQICFLEPEVIFIQFLKYLNSAYPEEKPDVKVPDKDGKEVDAEADYNTTKEDLKTPDKSIDDMGEEKEETKEEDKEGDEKEKKPKTDRYGYSYKSITLTKDEKEALPSKDTSSKDNSNGAFALNEEDGKVNASGSVSSQKTALSGVLSGFNSVLTAGLENAYILTYMFENFSYNTMIQDAVMEGEEESLKTNDQGTASLTKAKSLLKDTEVMDKYVGKMQTLSNMPKNAYNNYFYGAEVEYILYGNTSPAKNVSYAKASIYAIRFAFNCVYAFTDTEIRNTTMSAGLAVQAATLGIVPYQVVQIVLQLALAAAESAVDLDMMMTGLDVVLIKTKETWTLSVNNAVKSAGAFLAETAADYAGQAIDKAKGGLQELLDAGADQINGAITDLKTDLDSTTDEAVKNIADQIFGVALTELETLLNQMQSIEESVIEEQFSNNFDTYVDSKFAEVESTINTKLQEQFGGNELSKKVLDTIIGNVSDGTAYLKNVINSVKDQVKGYAYDLAPSQAVDAVIQNITSIKISMVNSINDVVTGVTSKLENIAKETVKSIHTKLDTILEEESENLKQGITDSIQKSITEATDNFVNNYIGEAVGSANKTGVSSSMSTLIKFGYKEYLMLFVYIGICADGNDLLTRTSDLIQLNLCHAGSGASFKHQKGDKFRMADACTYINLTVSAELDMFFVDLDLFSSVLEDPAEATADSEVTVETSDDGVCTKIVYQGLLGY